jgi:hypothetical protein
MSCRTVISASGHLSRAFEFEDLCWKTANTSPTRRPSIWPLARIKTVDPTIKPELLELAAVCEEVGHRINDHAIQNDPHDTLISAGLTWRTGASGAQSTAASLSYRQRGRTVTRRGLSTGQGEIRGKQD